MEAGNSAVHHVARVPLALEAISESNSCDKAQ